MNRPLIAIPLGDPAGIGPEIVVKALAGSELYELSRPLVVGDGRVVRQALKYCGLDMGINYAGDPEDGLFKPGTIDLIDLANVDTESLQVGKVQALGGRASFDFIEKSVQLALDKKVDAIATTPINKESLQAAGIEYIGHTEILAGLPGAHDPLTLFETGNLRVFFLTRHVSLRKACDLITRERLLDYIKRCAGALRRLGITEGTLAVAGLNPHCGEHGLFGDEEVNHIAPAVEEARRLGYDAAGPISADSVFHLALSGRYNSVLSLYHDQGHIATKTLDFERTISLTVGLPFLRTSVDHGTAYDIAGTGKASPVSMVEAVKAAAKYAPFYNRD